MTNDAGSEPTFEFGFTDAEDRLRELILYVAWSCEDDPTFGAVKLNKILYWSDMATYLQTGRPVTGVAYMKLPFGPAPRRLLPVREQMIAAREIVMRRAKLLDYAQNRMVPLREPSLARFTGTEISIVDKIIQSLWAKTAEEVSALSHGVAWSAAGDEELIPYEAAFLSDEPLSQADIHQARRVARSLRRDGEPLAPRS